MRRLLVLLLATTVACQGGGDRDGKRRRPPTPVTVVEVVPVTKGEVADLLLASATVEAERAADVTPETSGIVRAVLRDVGDPVREGDLLAVLDNVTLDAGAERARGEVAHLETQVAEVERLRQTGAASERELLDLRHQLDAARTSLREASRTAGEARLVAPFDGVVASRSLKVGELASGTTAAFRVVDLSDLRVRAKLPERDVGRVRVGQAARLVSAYDTTRSGHATVTRVAPVIDATTGTFEVTLALAPGEDALMPGQYVTVELEVDRHTDVVVVPKDAVRFEAGSPVAFVMVDAPPEAPDTDAEPDATADTDAPKDEGPRYVARRVEVELGLTDAARTEVTSGLSVGDRLIVVGHATLRDGARVREPRPPADAAGAAPDAVAAPSATPAASGAATIPAGGG